MRNKVHMLGAGFLDTNKPLVYAVINTANFDAMWYHVMAMDSSDGLETIGCAPEDIAVVDKLPVGGTYSAKEWPVENAIIFVKIKDDRKKMR